MPSPLCGCTTSTTWRQAWARSSTRSRRSAAAAATGLSHRSPIAPVERPARAAYRQRNPGLPLRALPDAVFDQFFVSLSSNRDRAIVAFAVSSGARAAELLGLRLEDLDVGRQLVALEGKGHHELQWVPASPDAFMWLAAYLAEVVGHRPAGDTRLWWTLRGPPRPLTYWALRQVLAWANEQLGSNITCHDLRHTYAMRLKMSDVARTASFGMVRDQETIRVLGFRTYDVG